MAIIEGGTSAALAGVGAEAASPLHSVSMSVSYGAGGAYSLGMASGTMAAALGSGSELFQFRYVTAASRICLVQEVRFSAGANVAATAAGLVPINMTVARSWTAAGSGGTRATLTGDNAQLRTSMATSEVNDAGISSTAALTAGTKTLDTANIGSTTLGIGTGALTVAANLNLCESRILFQAGGGGQYPLVLANQEGFVIRTGAAFPATMTWGFSVAVKWMEVPAY